MADRKPLLVVFARAPVAGRVKRRLAREIGSVAAVGWYRHQIAKLLREVGQDPRWDTVLAVTPDTAGRPGGGFPPCVRPGIRPGVPRIVQGRGDLGRRMEAVFRQPRPGPIAIIGSDIPGISATIIAEAFGMMGRADAVFGPAADGGFWLVGLARGRRRVPAGLFDNVRWSTHHALADSLATLAEHRISFAAPLADVDTATDLVSLGRHARAGLA
ncbi:MAG: TIGR04282 family arsenosugar biosynthesis glycosyltransferase [Pseudomonadota bacterium]